MATRAILISALNIVLPMPHGAERYQRLWLDAHASQRPIRLRKDTGGLIRGAHITKDTPDRIWGDLLKFTNIDDDRWFDLGTGEIAPAEDVEQKVSIPATYRANLHSVPYIFFPKQHRLLFMSKLDQHNSLTARMAKTLIEHFLSRTEGVSVSIEPDRETLRKIFDFPKLKSIKMEISPPNALGDMERKLLNYLEQQNATKYTQELSTGKPEGLKLTDETQEAAAVAQSNGYVEAKGVDETGRTVDLSTRDRPYSQAVIYDPGITTANDAFEGEAERVLYELSTPVRERA
jgi:hypothetical protein